LENVPFFPYSYQISGHMLDDKGLYSQKRIKYTATAFKYVEQFGIASLQTTVEMIHAICCYVFVKPARKLQHITFFTGLQFSYM
jgi:hypothetical protein